ncbi:uncharacterized protein LOC117588416 [Drosophila guanche]|uniref:Uncharacterized protein n=1 Tax=Drosophila guanche TaxID=7266 RepID=A0A3B0JX98_DROGU|nr:uncharacterized protein LOC117588416 [Drosophila guanche]SPP86684.1 Hypothetical predicted protein [Drosophila guanche]
MIKNLGQLCRSRCGPLPFVQQTPTILVKNFSSAPTWMGRAAPKPLYLTAARYKSTNTKWTTRTDKKEDEQEDKKEKKFKPMEPQARRLQLNKSAQFERYDSGPVPAQNNKSMQESPEEENPLAQKQKMEQKLKNKKITEKMQELMKARVANPDK